MCSKNLRRIQRFEAGRRYHDQICFIRDNLRKMMDNIHNAVWELHNGTSFWYLQKIVHISWDLVFSDFGVLDDIYNGRYQIIPREMCRLLEETENIQSENRKRVNKLQQENKKLRKQIILKKEGKKENETHSSTTLHGGHETDLNKVNEMQSRRKENSSEHLRPEQPLREQKTITNNEILNRIKKPKEMHNNSGLKEANETLQNNIKVLQESLKEKHAELEECRLQLHREQEQIMFLQLKMNDKVKLDKEQAKIKEQENISICSDLQQIYKIDEQKRKIPYLDAELETTYSNRKLDLGLEENLLSGEDIQLQLADTRCRLNDVQQELEETKSRLSRAMGDKLTDNNPNIADLSDKNRPTKISERYQELYDNQWTDAFEIIDKAFNNEEKTIKTLTVIINDAMKFCREEANNQMMEIKKSFVKEEELPSNMRKQVKDCRKALAELYGRGLFENYWTPLCNRHTEAREVPDYVKECFEICWLMAVQDPPVVFGREIRHNDNFNKDFYKAYTKSGDRVEYVVWPVLLLHQDGPVLCKGVAQGKEK